MSLIRAAANQVKRYGFKGAAKLTSAISKEEDLNNLSVNSEFAPQVDLSSYIGDFGADQINGTSIFSTDRKVTAVPDQDWNGIITESDKLEIDGKNYSIESFNHYKIKNVIAYVEIQARG